METAPAVRLAAQAPATPKRMAAQATSGSGAYSSSGARCGLLNGMKNSKMQMASVASASVPASAARLTEIGLWPFRSRSAQWTMSGTSVTTANVLVTVRATMVSHRSFEMPDSLKPTAMTMLVSAGASRPPNRTSVKALRTRSNRSGEGAAADTASAPRAASPMFAKYWMTTCATGNSGSCANRWKGTTAARYLHQCSRGVSSNAASTMALGAQRIDTGAEGKASVLPTSAAM